MTGTGSGQREEKERDNNGEKPFLKHRVGAAWGACQHEEMRLALHRCGGSISLLEGACAYVLIGVPESGEGQGHQCYITEGDKHKKVYCSSRGHPSMEIKVTNKDHSTTSASIIIDVQFSVINVNSSVFPTDFEISNFDLEKTKVWGFESDSYVISPLHTSSAQEDCKLH